MSGAPSGGIARTQRSARDRDYPRLMVVAVFAALLLVKALLLMAIGPIITPDGPGYIDVAAQMLRSSAWLHDARLDATAIPALAFRAIGYPAVIAAAMVVSGEGWAYAVIALQFVLSLGAGWLVFQLALEWGLPWKWTLASVVAWATSVQLTLDQCILTDSLHASLVIVAICLVARGAAAGRPLQAGAAVVAGVLIALALLLREAMQFLAVALLPILAARLWCIEPRKWAATAAACILALAPLFAAIEAYKAWNVHRTGERFVTTGGQTAVMYALVRAADHDPQVFGGSTAIDAAARAVVRHHIFAEISAINTALFRGGFRAPAIARMAYEDYVATWREQPLAMLRVVGENISERQLKLTFRPVSAVCESLLWATGRQVCPGYRELLRAAGTWFANRPPSAAILFLLISAERVVAIVVFLAFFIGIPAMAVRRHRRLALAGQRLTVVLAALWVAYIAWFMVYALVHIEERYMAPLIPFSALGGLVVLRALGGARRGLA